MILTSRNASRQPISEQRPLARLDRPRILLVVLAAAFVACDAPPAPAPPDLVVVSLDTLRADHLDLYGYPRRTAPNLARFAEEAVVFDRAYSQSPKTAPSHMSLFTGLLPAAHGVRNIGDGPPVALGPEVQTLAEILARSGYQTAARTGGGHVTRALGFDRGFQSFAEGGTVEAIFADSAKLADEMAARGEPYFQFVHTYEIHDPYVPPARFQVFNDPTYSGEIVGDRSELRALAGEDWPRQHEVFWERVDRADAGDVQRLRDLYDASILHTDVQLGRVIDALHRDGRWDRSLVIVLSDHGEEFGDHGGFQHEAVYEELLHVPLIIRFPTGRGAAWRGRRIDSVVRLIDVLPTLLDYLGMPQPSGIQGRSLLPLLEGAREVRGRPVHAHWPRDHPRGEPRSLRLDQWKLIVDGRNGAEELYDLHSDPGETRNLAAIRSEQARSLREAMARLLAESESLLASRLRGPAAPVEKQQLDQLRALGYLQ